MWVTGGGTGIGRALALEFARQGAAVAVSGRRADRLATVVSEIEASGHRGLAVPCDVTDEDRMTAVVESIVGQLGRLDVAVANAGFGVSARFEDITAEMWRRQLDVNVVGVAITARAALPRLRETNGRLALISSVSGQIAVPHHAAYTASKYAVRAIGQTISLELPGSGVSCTTIYPGFVKSDIARVDNQGVFHEGKKDKRPQRLMWTAEKAARVMARAIDRRHREYVFTAHGKVAAWFGRHLPAIAHFALTRKI